MTCVGPYCPEGVPMNLLYADCDNYGSVDVPAGYYIDACIPSNPFAIPAPTPTNFGAGVKECTSTIPRDHFVKIPCVARVEGGDSGHDVVFQECTLPENHVGDVFVARPCNKGNVSLLLRSLLFSLLFSLQQSFSFITIFSLLLQFMIYIAWKIYQLCVLFTNQST